jgi:hypothetical protein
MTTLCQRAEVAGRAVAQLNLADCVLHPTQLFGSPIVLAVRVDRVAHRQRRQRGEPPETDGRALATWEWPECRTSAPVPVISLQIALAVTPCWKSGVQVAARWAAFGPAAVVTTSASGASHERRALECLYRGVGCIDVDNHGLIVRLPPPSTRAPGSRRRTLDRWMEESVYAELLGRGQLS